ncbi:MAG: HNH endonuclease [Acidobacteriaceae bacterium]
MQQHGGRLPCEICGFDFLESYGLIGAKFAEAHHLISLANSPRGGRITSLHDFAVVCANCHRMLHRTPELPTVDSLRDRIRASQRKAQKGVPGNAKKGRSG